MQGKRLKKHSRLERQEKHFKSNFCFHLARLLILAGETAGELGLSISLVSRALQEASPRTQTEFCSSY